jgi:hypothetical protein
MDAKQPSACFALVGASWRAQDFLRIAQLLSERFRMSGMVVRNPEGPGICSPDGVCRPIRHWMPCSRQRVQIS